MENKYTVNMLKNMIEELELQLKDLREKYDAAENNPNKQVAVATDITIFTTTLNEKKRLLTLLESETK